MAEDDHSKNQQFCLDQAAQSSGPTEVAWLEMAERWASLIRGKASRGGMFGPGIELRDLPQMQQQPQPKPEDEK